MRVVINPSREEMGSGTSSFASWDNPSLVYALRSAFALSPNEVISQIEVTDSGIQVRIENKNKESGGGE